MASRQHPPGGTVREGVDALAKAGSTDLQHPGLPRRGHVPEPHGAVARRRGDQAAAFQDDAVPDLSQMAAERAAFGRRGWLPHLEIPVRAGGDDEGTVGRERDGGYPFPVPGDSAPAPGAPRVPESHGVIPTDGRQEGAIGGERTSPDRRAVPFERGCRPLQVLELVQPRQMVVAGGHKPFTVRTDTAIIDGPEEMNRYRPRRPRLIRAANEQDSAQLGKRDEDKGVNWRHGAGLDRGTALQKREFAERARPPQSEHPFIVAGRYRLAVVGERAARERAVPH